MSRMIGRVANSAPLITDPAWTFFGKTDAHRDSEAREAPAGANERGARGALKTPATGSCREVAAGFTPKG
jgi:hypothetical protein